MQRIPIASILLIAILAFLCSCATPKIEQRIYSSVSDAPVITFSHGGAWSPQFRYTVNGVHACREVYRPKTDPRTNITNFKIAQQQKVTPNAEQWQAFWHRIDPLRLSDWRATYDSKDIEAQVYDGTQWSLRYSSQGTEHRSSGDNGYPRFGKPKVGTLDSESFDTLLAAFDLLFPNSMVQFAEVH